MPKPGGDPSFGISLGDVLRLPKRHPACRWREAQPGSCAERENLDGDAKGKSTEIPRAYSASTTEASGPRPCMSASPQKRPSDIRIRFRHSVPIATNIARKRDG